MARGRGGSVKTAPSTRPARVPKAPKTAEDLDRELEAYLVSDANSAVLTVAAAADVVPSTSAPTEDVDMA